MTITREELLRTYRSRIRPKVLKELDDFVENYGMTEEDALDQVLYDWGTSAWIESIREDIDGQEERFCPRPWRYSGDSTFTSLW